MSSGVFIVEERLRKIYKAVSEMEQTQKQPFFSTTRIAFIAMFATLAGVLYVLNFSLPFAFPSFLEFKLSDVPILIGTFTLGPSAGAALVVIEILIKLVIKGTSTMFVGELSDLMTSCAFAVVAGIIYLKHRTFKGALVAMAVGTAVEVVVALLFNRFVLVPFYITVFFHGSWEPLIGLMTPLFPNCTKDTFYTFYLWASVLPFNLLRCLVADVITLLVYKRISRLINTVNHKIYGNAATAAAADGESQTAGSSRATRMRKINVAVIISAAVAVALLLAFALLRYFVF